MHESFSGDGLIVARFGATHPDWHRPNLSYNRHSTSFFRHLAYDLSDKINENHHLAKHSSGEAEGADTPPRLKQRGSLLEISASGALGDAGDTLVIPDDEVIGRYCRRHAEWELDNVRDFASHIKHARQYTLIDVGANIGLFSRQLSRMTDSISRLICIEPDGDNFSILKFNLSNLKPRTEFHNYALASSDGTAVFFRDLENSGNYSLNEDAMRDRRFSVSTVETRNTSAWAKENLEGTDALLWKSDTQGFDEIILSQIPLDIWMRVEVAMLEMWRIAKPNYDLEAFRARLAEFPHRQLGENENVSVDEILDYLNARDWTFKDLLLWRGQKWSPPKVGRRQLLKGWAARKFLS